MKIKILGSIVSVLALTLAYPAVAGGGKQYVLNVVGTGHAYDDLVPDLDEDGLEDEATCFDVGLVDVKNGRVLGTATDCLSEISDDTDSGNTRLIGTTYFHLPQGTLITRGKTTVAPVEHDTVIPGPQPVTHITGASGEGNAIIGGTGRFADRTGTARLSGMVNLSMLGDGYITFDCLFVINLD